jgi:hypothetical protein
MRAAQIGFDQLVQDFFLRRMIDQRGASARTVESYRDVFELLFGYIETPYAKPPRRADRRQTGHPGDPGLPQAPRDRPGQQRPHCNARLAGSHF